MCSLINHAHTKIFFIKGWVFSDKVSPIVACFFFCHKFLVNLSRQNLIESVAAQHQGFQNYARLAGLSRFHFPSVCHFLHHCPLRSPWGARAWCIPCQQCWEGMDKAQSHESSSQLFCNLFCETLLGQKRTFPWLNRGGREAVKQDSKYSSLSKRISSAGPSLCQSNRQSAKIMNPLFRIPWVWLVSICKSQQKLSKKERDNKLKIRAGTCQAVSLVPVVCERWLNRSSFSFHPIPNCLFLPPICLGLKKLNIMHHLYQSSPQLFLPNRLFLKFSVLLQVLWSSLSDQLFQSLTKYLLRDIWPLRCCQLLFLWSYFI